MNNKALSAVPILESMVFITLAVKWAMACGVKDRKVYKHLKKYYYQHRVEKQPGAIVITNGWAYQRSVGFFPYIGIRYIHFEWDGTTNLVVYRNDSVFRYDNSETEQWRSQCLMGKFVHKSGQNIFIHKSGKHIHRLQ